MNKPINSHSDQIKRILNQGRPKRSAILGSSFTRPDNSVCSTVEQPHTGLVVDAVQAQFDAQMNFLSEQIDRATELTVNSVGPQTHSDLMALQAVKDAAAPIIEPSAELQTPFFDQFQQPQEPDPALPIPNLNKPYGT